MRILFKIVIFCLLQDMRNTNKKLEEDMRLLTKNMEKLSKENESLINEKVTRNKDHLKRIEELEEKVSQNRSIELELAQAQSLKDAETEDKNKVMEDLKGKDLLVKELEESNSKLAKDLESLKKQLNESEKLSLTKVSQEEYDELQVKYDSKVKEHRDLSKLHTELFRKLESKSESIQSLTAKVEELEKLPNPDDITKEANEKLETIEFEHSKALEGKDAEIKQLKQEIESVTENRRKDLEKHQRTMQTAIDTSNAINRQQEVDLEEARSKIKVLEERLVGPQLQVSSEELKALKTKNTNLNTSYSQLSDKFDKAKKERDDKDEEIKNLKEKIGRLNTAVEVLRDFTPKKPEMTHHECQTDFPNPVDENQLKKLQVIIQRQNGQIDQLTRSQGTAPAPSQQAGRHMMPAQSQQPTPGPRTSSPNFVSASRSSPNLQGQQRPMRPLIQQNQQIIVKYV